MQGVTTGLTQPSQQCHKVLASAAHTGSPGEANLLGGGRCGGRDLSTEDSLSAGSLADSLRGQRHI